MLPLPVKYHLHFGEPMRFSGDPAEDESAIVAQVEQVRSALAALLQRGLQERKGIFRS